MTARDAVIAAVDRLRVAAATLPVEGSPRNSIRNGLREIDAAQEALREAVYRYVFEADRTPAGRARVKTAMKGGGRG